MYDVIVSIDCQWSNWSIYKQCSKSCDGGTQIWQRRERIKSKNGGKPCLGDAIISEDCNTQSCPNPGK